MKLTDTVILNRPYNGLPAGTKFNRHVLVDRGGEPVIPPYVYYKAKTVDKIFTEDTESERHTTVTSTVTFSEPFVLAEMSKRNPLFRNEVQAPKQIDKEGKETLKNFVDEAFGDAVREVSAEPKAKSTVITPEEKGKTPIMRTREELIEKLNEYEAVITLLRDYETAKRYVSFGFDDPVEARIVYTNMITLLKWVLRFE
jgi:hypothetical protein